MADWEAGYLVAELGSGRYFRKGAEKYEVATVGLSREAAITMGEVRVCPDLTIGELAAEDAALLILPGGNTWLEPAHAPVFDKVREFLDAGKVVSAICGATFGLAANGFLDRRHHTSNDLGFLKACCPAYRGEACYVHKPAVCDGKLVTATGFAPLEFACETLKKLDVFAPPTLEAWYRLNKTQEASYFYELMGSLPRP